MLSEAQIGRVMLACGAIGLGIVGILAGQFVTGLQPVPASLAESHLLAGLSGVVLALGGGLLLSPRHVRLGATIVAIYVAAWVMLLQPPRMVVHYANLAAWLGVAEAAAIAAGAWLLAGPARPALARAVEMLFGMTLLVFGACHFVYADFTAAMVPGWIPAPLFWAWATGLGHVAAGLAIIGDVKARLAASCLGAMCASFVLLVHVPRVLAAPDDGAEWKLLFVAMALTGAAWSVAAAIAVPQNSNVEAAEQIDEAGGLEWGADRAPRLTEEVA